MVKTRRKERSTSPGQKKNGAKDALLSNPWLSETPTSLEDFREEGELSGDDEDPAEFREIHMFSIEVFPRLMNKAIQTLGLAP